MKPSQLPVPTQRATPSSSGTTYNRASGIPGRRNYTRRYTDNDVEFHQDSDYPYPSSPDSSSVVSFHQNQSPLSYRVTSQGSNQDERSYSMSQSSVINHGISYPRLRSTNKLQVQGDGRDLRPRSPFAYPTRLKRPGYRPSSPALKELQKDSQGVSSGGYREANPGSASSMYSYAMRKAPPAWQQGSNHSDSLFQRHPPSPASRYSSARSSSPSSPRMPTPGPLLSLEQNTSVPRESPGPSSHKSGWTTRQSPSPSPVFYDYTESFEEENYSRKSVVTLAGDAIPENVDIVYQELDANSSGASEHEMHAYSEVPNALMQEKSYGVGVSEAASAVNGIASSQIPRRVTGSNHSSVFEVTPIDKGHITPIGRYQLRTKAKSFIVERPRSGEKDEAPTDSSKYSKVQRRTYVGLSFVRSKPRGSVASPPCSTSSSVSLYSAQSSSRLGQPNLDSPTEQSSRIEFHSEKSGELPINSDRSASSLENECQILLPQSKRPVSFDHWSDSEPSQIFAPTPERSLSSPSHRDKFSRIFSIGEGSADTNENNENFGRASKYRTTERRLKEEDTGDSGATNTSAFRAENLLTDPPKIAPEMRRPVIDSVFYDELKLNQAPEEELSRSQGTNLDGQGVKETRPEQPMIAAKTSKVSLSPRMSKTVTPTDSLPVSSSQVPTVDAIELSDPSKDSDPVRLALAERDNAKPRVAKRIPSLPNNPSFISYSPPLSPTSDTLPFSFKPLLASKTDNIYVVDPQNYDGEASTKEQDEGGKVEKQYGSDQFELRVPHNSTSTESLPGSRPWHLDTSYPWIDQQPELEMTMPQPRTDSLQSTNKPPRFKLKVHRASSSVTGSAKLTKQPRSLDLSAIRKRNMSSELSQTGSYTYKHRASITISQSNSSHVSQVVTQYSEKFDSPPASSAISPSIKLVPPSPGLNHEVRSFFSDDSSQVQPKGSLRKRISQLKAIAAKTNSTEDITDTDRGVLGSVVGKSRASGRTSRQEAAASERMYNLRHLKWRIVEKVRDWFHRGEGKVRCWRGKMTSKGLKGISPSEGFT